MKRPFEMLTLLLLMILLQLYPAQSVRAHGEGGVLQIGDRAVGQYLLHAWTSPGIPRLGETHLEALITTRDGRPLDGCHVELVVTSHEDQSSQHIVTSTPIYENQFRHEGIAILSTPGRYSVDVIVSEEGVQIGQSSFDITVPPPPLWLQIGLNGVLLCLAATGLWFFRQGYNLLKSI